MRKPPLPLKAAAVVDMAAVADIMVAAEAEAVAVDMAVGVATTTAQAKRRAPTRPPDGNTHLHVSGRSVGEYKWQTLERCF